MSGTGAGLKQNTGSLRLTNGAYNGNAISPKYYSSGWGGGSVAQIKTFNLSSAGRVIGRAGTAGAVIYGAYDIGSNAYTEGGFGPNTQLATGRTTGSFLGTSGGVYIGAGIGSLFGGVGAIPGGIIGGIIFGYGGSKAGEEAVRQMQKN